MAESKKQINTSVDKRVYDAIKREADTEDRTFGKQVERILRNYVDSVDAAPPATQAPAPERAAVAADNPIEKSKG